MKPELSLTRKNDSLYKHLLSLITNEGESRTHALLVGEKVIIAWIQASKMYKNRFQPETWLRLRGANPSKLERMLTNGTLILSESLMRDLTDTRSSPEHALVVKIKPEISMITSKRTIVPWGIQNPGNLGAILRSAAAFGFQEALLGPLCADPFSQKVIRGSMGASFLMQLHRINTIVSANNESWFALDNNIGSLSLDNVVIKEPLKILVGNEGHGWQGLKLPSFVKRISIPTSKVESLNAAVATGIICFEVARRLDM